MIKSPSQNTVLRVLRKKHTASVLKKCSLSGRLLDPILPTMARPLGCRFMPVSVVSYRTVKVVPLCLGPMS